MGEFEMSLEIPRWTSRGGQPKARILHVIGLGLENFVIFPLVFHDMSL